VPLLLLYLGSILSASGGGGVWFQTRELAGGLAVGAGWAVLMAAIGLALASFSAKRAYATGAIAIFFFLTWTLAQIIYSVAGQGALAHQAPVPVGPGAHLRFHAAIPVPATGQRLSGLISPFTVIDGVRQWLGGKVPGPMAAPGRYGALYGAMFLVLLVASLAIFAARYRKAGTE
jgi:ABC-2 type transport system permease protein